MLNLCFWGFLNVVLLSGSLQPRRRSFTSSDYELLDQLLFLSEPTASRHDESEIMWSRPDYFQLAIIAPSELSICKKMFEGLLAGRSGTKVTELRSNETDERQFEVKMRGRELKLREARQPLEGMVLGSDIVLLLIEGKSEDSICKAIRDINTIRSNSEKTAIGVMVINGKNYAGLRRILDEAFDERCMAFVFNGNMDSDAAWYTILELVNMFESDRSGSECTKLSSARETESNWSNAFSSWSTYSLPSKIQEQCAIQ